VALDGDIETVISMSTRFSSGRHEYCGISPEFIKEVEDELSCHLGQPVTVTLGNGIVVVGAQRELFAGQSAVVMDLPLLLARRRPAEWADAFERKVDRLSKRAKDVEQLYAEMEESPSPAKTGTIVLDHVSDYDDDFFEALAAVTDHEKGGPRLGRARNFEALREYLRMVRRRARDGETAAMRRELDQGAALESAPVQPHRVAQKPL
jgi:hypothetical protein